VLLSDQGFAQFASANLVTSWEKVRDVPKVSIDFGDGKTLKRTLKGNTVLYLCTPDGKIVDAWPGVYTPELLMPEIKTAVARAAKGEAPLRQWHEGLALQTLVVSDGITMSKAVVEAPLLKALGYKGTPQKSAEGLTMPPLIDPFGLSGIADGRTRFASAFTELCTRVADLSERPMTSETARKTMIGEQAGSLSPEEAGIQTVIRDANQNRKVVRPLVHIWLASFASRPTPKDGRDPMFKGLFHLPIDDPYLGLAENHMPGTPNP
jgi:hypothetical protein